MFNFRKKRMVGLEPTASCMATRPDTPTLVQQPTLLCCQGKRRYLAQASVEVAGERTFDATACLPHGLAGSEEPLVVGASLSVVADACEGDDVERPVELAIAATVEPMASLLAARGVDRAGARERSEGSLACHPARVTARNEQLGAADRSHAALLEQIGGDLGEQLSECTLGLCHLAGESLDALAEPTQNAVRDIRARP
jgi:hypothetical protein